MPPSAVDVVASPTLAAKQALASKVLHRSTRADPPEIVSASGCWLTLSTGQKIFDATGGPAVSCLGHGNRRVQQAVLDQMSRISYAHSMFFSSSAFEGLAKELIDSTAGEMSKVFIVSSGSEAMEAALKLSRQYFIEIEPPQPQRFKFIARKESYHGTTLGALSVGGHKARRALFEPMLTTNVGHVSPCNAYRGMQGLSVEEYVAKLAKELDDEFQRLGPETVCAFVAEPVVGAALGCVPAVPGYFKAMKAVCEKYGALLIMDEVMCGMGRSGTLHAWQQEGVSPDIQTIGKGLGGGYAPIAGLLINHRVVDALDKGTGAFMHGHTYQGHTVACASSLEVQRIIREENLLANVAAMGKYLSELLHKRLDDHPYVGDIRGKGLFWGIEFVQDKTTQAPFPRAVDLANAISQRGFEPGYDIEIYPGTGTVDGVLGDHIIISPPYTVTKSEVEHIVGTVVRLIEDVLREKVKGL